MGSEFEVLGCLKAPQRKYLVDIGASVEMETESKEEGKEGNYMWCIGHSQPIGTDGGQAPSVEL